MRISDWSSDVCSSDLFADIARPVMLDQVPPHAVVDRKARVPHLGRRLVAEIGKGLRNVGAPFAQRRATKLHDMEAVIKTIAELAGRDGRASVELGHNGRAAVRDQGWTGGSVRGVAGTIQKNKRK